jgi:hypothetical protein
MTEMTSKKIYYQKHNEEILEKKRIYYIENKAIIADKNKIHYQKNREELLKKDKIYYENNKEKKAEKIDCSCGGIYRKTAQARHLRTKKHIDFIQNT